ncbi:TolC family protein, partial [bacterium]|nr:TolC family protein [bacterium]
DAAVQTSIPIFDRNQGNRVKAASYTSQAQHNIRAAELALLAEIEGVLKELTNAYANAQLLTSEQLKLASEVRDSFIQAYQVGGRPILDVIDSQRSYRETYRSYIVTRATYWRAVYKFSASIGRQLGNNEPTQP